jgi:hypothetical protein
MTRTDAISAAGRVLARARYLLMELSPRESAMAAYVPGGPSVDDLERRIRALRGDELGSAA